MCKLLCWAKRSSNIHFMGPWEALSIGLRLPLLSPPYHSSDSDDAKSAPGDDSQGISKGDVSNFCLPICNPWCWNMHTNICPNVPKSPGFVGKSTSTMVRIWLGECWWFVPRLIWVNYNDLTATSLESWLIRGIIPKWPYFRLVKYCNLPRLIKQ